MSSRVEENEIALRFWLELRPHGTEGDRSTLGVVKISDIEINVHLLRHRSCRPCGRDVVVYPHGGQQEVLELDHDNFLRGDNDLSAQQIRPELGQSSRISAVKRDGTQTHLRRMGRLQDGLRPQPGSRPSPRQEAR